MGSLENRCVLLNGGDMEKRFEIGDYVRILKLVIAVILDIFVNMGIRNMEKHTLG